MVVPFLSDWPGIPRCRGSLIKRLEVVFMNTIYSVPGIVIKEAGGGGNGARFDIIPLYIGCGWTPDTNDVPAKKT